VKVSPFDADYSWVESPTVQTFFIIVSAITVPIWVFRMAKGLRKRLPLGGKRLSLSFRSAATGARAQSFFTKEQEDRRGDKD
jgi:hypothetical protein